MSARVMIFVVGSLLVACRYDVVGPQHPDFTTYYGCETDPNCSGGGGGGFGTDPNPSAPGYWMGTTVTPATCVSLTGAGINDVDDDATNDYCEELLAWKFRPGLVFSDYDCNVGMEPYWAAKAFPNQGNLIRIAYLFSYYQDCGLQDPSLLQSVGCTVAVTGVRLFTFNSTDAVAATENKICDGHAGDSEFLTVDLRYDAASQHWYVAEAFFSAHFPSSNSQRVGTAGIDYGDKYGGYPRVWVSEGKHANYVSRGACNSGGTLGSDTCESNPNVDTRIRYSSLYNVGSAVSNAMNTGTCVTGGLLVQYYPENYGTECYWVRGRSFTGWYQYPWGERPTDYYSILMMTFECYAYQLTPSSGGLFTATCTDWGVRPSQNRPPPPPPPLPSRVASISGPTKITAKGMYTWEALPSGGSGGYTYAWSLYYPATGRLLTLGTGKTQTKTVFADDDLFELRVTVTSGSASTTATLSVSECIGSGSCYAL
jgi:hypothetical protein